MGSVPAASAILAPLLAFLAARWLALLVGKRYPNGRVGTMAALGVVSSVALSAIPTIRRLEAGAYWLAADAASVAAMGALGATLGARLGVVAKAPGRAVPSDEPAAWRRGLALALPLGVGFAIAAVFGLPTGADGQAVARAAVAFAATLWLAVDARPPALALAGVALVFAQFRSPAITRPPIQPVVAAIATIAAIAAAAATYKARPARDTAPALASSSPSAQAAEAFQAFAAVALAWSLTAAGLGWPAAGLVAGAAGGLAGRRARHASSASGTGRFKIESAMALAFIAGYGVSAPKAAANLPAALVIAASILVATALVSVLARNGLSRVPVAAGAFAAMLVARRSGLASDAAMAGLVLAYLVAIPVSARASARPGTDDTARRIGTIVGVRPGADNLAAMALGAALDGRDRPVMAACVAAPEGSPGLGVDQAEETLVRCVAAAASTDVRVVPTLVASRTVAAGLAGLASERGAELLLVGFDDEQNPSGTVDGLLASFPGAVIAVKRPGEFQAAKRLVALAVSGAEASPGFGRAIAAIARAWAGDPKSVEAVMIGAPASAMLEAAEGLLRPSRASSVASWRDVPAAIGTPTSDEAAFVVFSSRPGAKDWNPGHERLPVVMSSSFPDSPTLLWFPPTASDDADKGDDAPAPALPTEPVAASEPYDRLPTIVQAAYAAGRVFVDMGEDSLVDAIRRLTDSIFPFDRVASGRLAAQFSTVARKEPIELAPGILLLHAHAPGVSQTTLAIGSRPDGWPIIALSSPVRVAVALVSPDDSGPEAHLDALSEVATAFRNLGLAELLQA